VTDGSAPRGTAGYAIPPGPGADVEDVRRRRRQQRQDRRVDVREGDTFVLRDMRAEAAAALGSAEEEWLEVSGELEAEA
jgi:hypothetical protein